MVFVKTKITNESLKDFYENLEPATQGSAGLDLRANIEDTIYIYPEETVMIGSGISIELPDNNYAGFVYPRSGLGTRGLILANTVGVIDSDYRGEIKIPLYNRGKERITLCKGDRIAQLVVQLVNSPKYILVDELSETDRGTNGFGSTGHK